MDSDIRVVVGLDFGATYSGFSYCHVACKQYIITNDNWPGDVVFFKTNTVLQYDEDYERVILWGAPALCKRRKEEDNRTKPVELLKLHLSNLQNDLKPKLPDGLGYKKVISDYLREFGKVWSNY